MVRGRRGRWRCCVGWKSWEDKEGEGCLSCEEGFRKDPVEEISKRSGNRHTSDAHHVWGWGVVLDNCGPQGTQTEDIWPPPMHWGWLIWRDLPWNKLVMEQWRWWWGGSCWSGNHMVTGVLWYVRTYVHGRCVRGPWFSGRIFWSTLDHFLNLAFETSNRRCVYDTCVLLLPLRTIPRDRSHSGRVRHTSAITLLFVFLLTEQSYRYKSFVNKVTALLHLFLNRENSYHCNQTC